MHVCHRQVEGERYVPKTKTGDNSGTGIAASPGEVSEVKFIMRIPK